MASCLRERVEMASRRCTRNEVNSIVVGSMGRQRGSSGFIKYLLKIKIDFRNFVREGALFRGCTPNCMCSDESEVDNGDDRGSAGFRRRVDMQTGW